MAKKNQRLENLKLVLKDVELHRHAQQIELSSGQSDKVATFKIEAELYLHSFIRGLNIQEIIQQENASGRHVDFVLLKDILSKLYWQHHLVNEAEFAEAIECSEGVPAFDSLIADPLVDLSLDHSTNPILFCIPIALSAMALKLLLQDEVSSFFILFFPQVFLTIKGLLSIAVSRFFFKNLEPTSLHFSLLGIYYKLSPGRRTVISGLQFLFHLVILLGAGAVSLLYFHQSKDIIFLRFGPLATCLLLIIHLSPIHNTDLSNLNFQIQNNVRKRLGIAAIETNNDKFSRGLYRMTTLLYNVLALAFCTYCAVSSIQLVMTKNMVFLIYQIVFDIAAIALFFDFIDQFEKIFESHYWSQTRYLASKFKASLKNYKNSKDMSPLIRSIPIFEGIPEETYRQMTQSSKMIEMKPGSRVCKEGDTSTDMYVVIEGQVGIFKKQKNGKTQKVIDINEGSIFGEGAFLLGKPRSGSAYCLKKTRLLVIKRPQAFVTSDRTQEKNLTQFQKKIWGFQALAQSEFFKELPSEAVMQLINHGEVLDIAPQTYVVKQGDPSDSLWVIIQGQCTAVVDGKPVRDMTAKDVFGEIGLLWSTLRTSSVVTSSSSVLLRVNATQVWELMAHNLNIGIALQELGEQRLQSARPS